MHTLSYSPKLEQYSVYYKSFYGVLNVRTISAEYLIAMKLCSGRKYKMICRILLASCMSMKSRIYR